MQCSTQDKKCRVCPGVKIALIFLAGYVIYSVFARGGTEMHPVAQREPVKQFAMTDLNGQTWNLDDHRGKVVVLNFWATWCPPCQRETPDLVDVANRYKNKGVEFAGVALDEGSGDAVQQFVDQYKIPYAILRPAAGLPCSQGSARSR